jgi:hypothetical protein
LVASQLVANIYFEKLHENICGVATSPKAAKLDKPLWWKSMPKYIDADKAKYPKDIKHRDFSTIRNCPGIQDIFDFGYIVYFPTDVYIDSTDKENMSWFAPNVEIKSLEKTNLKYIDYNSPESVQNFSFPEGFHKISIKINSLWGIKTDSGYSIWIAPLPFFDQSPLRPVDAIVDSDVFPLRAPVSFFVKENFKGVIKAGFPMYRVIPFKRESFQSHIVSVDASHANKMVDIIDSVFTSPYKKFFWKRKSFN